MPYAIVTIGLILAITSVQDTFAQLGTQLQSDFVGNNNFVFWVAAIGSVGALGYIKDLQTFSTLFMTLIIVALLLAQQKNSQTGFFGQLISDLKAGPNCQPSSATAATSNSLDSAVSNSVNWYSSFLKSIGAPSFITGQ